MSQPSGSNRWIKCISTHGNVRGVAIQATELVREQAKLHGLTGNGAHGLAEALLGGLLLGSYCKMGERVNLNVQGGGSYVQALVDAYPDGRVRGYVVERTLRPAGAEIVFEGGPRPEGPWGTGFLSVLRTKDQEGQRPYIGTVPLVTGHLAKDLAFYWAQSEQVPSAVGLVVEMDGQEIRSAGAFLVQVMPGASPEEVQLIEGHISSTESLAGEFSPQADPMSFLARVFGDLTFVVLEERELKSYCNCSSERVERALALVGVTELRSMLAEDRGASVNCDFCCKTYEVDATRLESMIERLETPAGGGTSH